MAVDDETEQWFSDPVASCEQSCAPYPFQHAITRREDLPALPSEQIAGLLRHGSMMLLQGASKMGKSFALIELSVALATGGEWLGFRCERSRVLYVNLEIQSASFFERVLRVVEATGADESAVQENLYVWNARGENLTVKEISAKIKDVGAGGALDAVVIDPLYKIQLGNENDAESINRFFNAVDALAQENGISVIMCHHHSKGGQLRKAAIDRSSGSGVFGRAADLIVDFTEQPNDSADYEAKKEAYSLQGAVPFWVSFVARDFKPPDGFGAWFDHPVHICDPTGLLHAKAPRERAVTVHKHKEQDRVDNTIEELIQGKQSIQRKEVVKALGMHRKTVDKYLSSSIRFDSETINNNTCIIKRREEG